MINKLPFKFIFTALVFFMSITTVSSQVSLKEISLKDQIGNSSLVVEGKVIAKKSFWDADHKMIYTAYTIDVYKVFKGESYKQIEVIVKGGIVGLNAFIVSHGLKLGKGLTGVFTLNESNLNIGLTNTISAKTYKVYSGVQGFYNYNLSDDIATNPFSERKGIKSTLYEDIIKVTKKNYKIVSNFDIDSVVKKSTQKKSSSTPTGITFSPTTISAGTGSVLTIQGSGFGSTQGKVGFRDSDSAGSPFFDALDTHVLSWSDNLITVEVPVILSNDDNIDGTAGTGNIRVTDSEGSSNTSSAVLSISYSEINVSGDFGVGDGFKSYQTQHHNNNGSGGYTWIMENDFFNELTHADAPDAFLRAFNNWRCETKVNWEISNTFTNTSVISTSENIISFDYDGTDGELDAGILGTCTYGFSGSVCSSGIVWYVTDIDIVFDRETNWYFGTGDITNKFDFETVALHELGHGHQLGHVINTSNVMHFSIGEENINTILDTNSITGANDVQTRSVFSHSCAPAISPMTEYTGNCELSVEDINLENSVSVYPNPTKQKIYIDSPSYSLDRIEIYDVSGRLISQIDVSNSSNFNTINLENTSKGMYFVNIYSGVNFITKKIVVE
ncbi:T9SS type A sorting domain-containing protein [uncultured Algibacter sp.]|uniref:T9SS type A sorting domain-containing protein n=1 Tax=uncultured Algibacter sp. TaxID=298659 RepID=UPI0026205662|nr:T9SS type A sorting domain-containing protein [uncultured Algibacter sp.]